MTQIPKDVLKNILLFLNTEELEIVSQISSVFKEECEQLQTEIDNNTERSIVMNHLENTYSSVGFKQGVDSSDELLLQSGFYIGFVQGTSTNIDRGIQRGICTAKSLLHKLFDTPEVDPNQVYVDFYTFLTTVLAKELSGKPIVQISTKK